IVNPVVEGLGLAAASFAGLVRRFSAGGAYPGLVQMLEQFYSAVATEGISPVSPQHLEKVVQLYEDIAMNVLEAVRSAPDATADEPLQDPHAPVVALTGAGGFLGRETAAALVARGFR